MGASSNGFFEWMYHIPSWGGVCMQLQTRLTLQGGNEDQWSQHENNRDTQAGDAVGNPADHLGYWQLKISSSFKVPRTDSCYLSLKRNKSKYKLLNDIVAQVEFHQAIPEKRPLWHKRSLKEHLSGSGQKKQVRLLFFGFKDFILPLRCNMCRGPQQSLSTRAVGQRYLMSPQSCPFQEKNANICNQCVNPVFMTPLTQCSEWYFPGSTVTSSWNPEDE